MPIASAAQAADTGSLEAMSGEYTDPTDPDTPLSFYVKNGKLAIESERRVPAELKAVSATEFARSRRNCGCLRSAGRDFQAYRHGCAPPLSRLSAE
jgi:hypothetical protein